MGAIGGMMLSQNALTASAPTPGNDNVLAGVIEMHVHGAPDITPRVVHEIELAQKVKEAGMRGVVFKCHDFITNDRAYMVKLMVPGVELFGGIVLNEPVGGINPVAVETMLKFIGGLGRYVWLPTRDAAYQKAAKANKPDAGGVRVTDSAGAVLPDVRKVMKIVAKADAILGTGHIGPKESVAVVKAAKEEGVRKIVITHAMQDPLFMSLEDMKRCAEMGAYIEHCYLSHLLGPTSPAAGFQDKKGVSMEAFVKAIKEVGAERTVVATDLGQTHNPTPVDGMRDFIRQLMKKGVTEAEVGLMTRRNPARLLGLEPF
jgi:hypothetical protein